MGFLEVLTIVLVVLQLAGVISWSWWLVLLPAIIAVGIYIIIGGLFTFGAFKTHKTINKEFDKHFNNDFSKINFK